MQPTSFPELQSKSECRISNQTVCPQTFSAGQYAGHHQDALINASAYNGSHHMNSAPMYTDPAWKTEAGAPALQPVHNQLQPPTSSTAASHSQQYAHDMQACATQFSAIACQDSQAVTRSRVEWEWEAAAGPGKEDPFFDDWKRWAQGGASAAASAAAAAALTVPQPAGGGWAADGRGMLGWLNE
jgi:hypothetical protein